LKRVVVLGAGLVGGLIARDVASDPEFDVTAYDASASALARLAGTRIATRRADLSDARAVRDAVAGVDAVAVALPGFMGTNAVRAVIEAGRPLADISFSPEDPLALDARARSQGVPAIVDCGVAPGLSNLFCGLAQEQTDALERVSILVGGLPARRVWPYEYRLVFSLTDVLEEYTRPSRFREAGRLVVREALSEVEPVDIPRVGTLEAFNTDGLRTLLSTIDAPDLKEKTLRWPGHADRMRMLRETGFLSNDPVVVGGVEVRPRALAEELLLRAWTRPDGEEEFTVLRVVAEGRRAGARVRLTWDLYDRTDAASGFTSMARTTGFPCAIAVRLLAQGAFTTPGVFPPERLAGSAAVVGALLDGLRARGVAIEAAVETVASA
jgi:saccharopine dehydrogenase-like NADP-dependent oxidoreductase